MALEFVQGQNLSLGTVFTITWAHGLNSREDSMNVDTEELVVRQLMMQIDFFPMFVQYSVLLLF